MEFRKLLTLDFDGTTHLTSEPAPNGHTVDSAYAAAIADCIGVSESDYYLETGGHNHRTPAEIVSSLLPSASQDLHEKITRRVTAAKLEILLDCIGQPMADGELWPRLTPGFAELWNAIDQANQRHGLIGRAILSAGHTEFQVKAFKVHNLTLPDIFFTADTLDALRPTIPAASQYKPGTFMLEMAKQIWAYPFGLESGFLPTIHVGDSIEKDEAMARNANIPFELIEPETSILAWQRVGRWLGVGNIAINGAVDGI